MPEEENTIEEEFPALRHSNYRIASQTNYNYNCLAWALNDTNHWWDKSEGCFWPFQEVPDDTIEGWIRIFEIHGFIRTESKEFEPGFEKVAVFAKLREPEHVARQMPSGYWTSKLGLGCDIEHETLESLEGESYGTVSCILRRWRKDRSQ